ncbi:OLC1v1008315C3 [Oldenlandia corymbosa var. corymbosa]|nr:OLC1v1008315C3 [Oldenlandia corymbosa var. corymbosa]
MYPWSLVIRVKRCWDRLKNWLAANFPEVLGTLRNGATEEEIKNLEVTLQVKLPLPTRVLYRFCDGQELDVDESSGSADKSLLGLIGGYSFYSHLVNVFLLPSHRVIEITKIIQRQSGFNNRSKYIAVAVSSIYSGKFFFLDCTRGQLFVGTRNLTSDGEMITCVPESLLSSVHDSDGSLIQDAMLLWLEEHARRLESGIVKVRKEGDMKWINLFPEQPPLCSTAVTNGVKVRASSVFVPEQSNCQDEDDRFCFGYSIRMSLLSEGCIINGMKFGSCQLYWRNWVIRANDTVVDNFNGEGVIGKFPLLRPGEEEFVYESCTYMTSSPGSIEGFFTFIPGRLADPVGAPFQVEVASFPLQVPDYIF